MRIVFSVGDRPSAAIALPRLLTVLNLHQIKIAGYVSSTTTLSHNIDWTLDALHYGKDRGFDILGRRAPRVSASKTEAMVEDIINFNPDLIVCDCEPIVSNIAAILSKPLWYCSPIHLLDGVGKSKNQIRSIKFIRYYRDLLKHLPKAEKKLIYSPFGCISNAPRLRPGYEWVTPYHTCKPMSDKHIGIVRRGGFDKIMKALSIEIKTNYESCNWLFCGGETSYIADAVYSGVPICSSPSLDDIEALLNSMFCEITGVGTNLGQVELMNEYSVPEIEKQFNLKTYNPPTPRHAFLHERIEQYACSF